MIKMPKTFQTILKSYEIESMKATALYHDVYQVKLRHLAATPSPTELRFYRSAVREQSLGKNDGMLTHVDSHCIHVVLMYSLYFILYVYDMKGISGISMYIIYNYIILMYNVTTCSV